MIRMDRVKELKKTLIGWVEKEVGEGMCGADIEKLGEVVDMVKDLAETEKECMEAEYYETIIAAMEESEPEHGKFGYDHWRNASGQFAKTGHGHYSGYTSAPIMKNGTMHVREPHTSGDFRMGYPMDGRSSNGNQNGNGVRYGHMPMDYGNDMMPWSENGVYYDDWQNHKRHYSETGSKEDEQRMQESLAKNISVVMTQVKEMSEDATPENRRKLKAEMTAVMNDLNKMM